MKYQLGIFDWDGVLVNSKPFAHACACAIYKMYGVTPPPEDVFLRGINSTLEVYYCHGIPRTVTRAELTALWSQHFLAPEIQKRVMLRSGAREILHACRSADMRTAIVSGNDPRVIEAGLRRFGLHDLVDVVRGNANKKDGALREVLKRLIVSPYEAFFVGDTPEDVTAAKQAGVRAIAIRGGFGRSEDLVAANPKFFIGELAELIPKISTPKTKEVKAKKGGRA